MIADLNNSLIEIKSLTGSNSKLSKEYSFMEHKYKII